MLNFRILKRSLCVLACGAAMVAQAEGQLVGAPSIVKSLSKDIVLDSAHPGNGVSRAVAVDLQVQFAFNSAELLPPGRLQLDELAQALNNKALISWGFELAGHTDRVGTADYNMKLSLERAMTVKNYLVVNRGINPGRLIPIGLGFSHPVNPADPGAAINRRVEVRKVALQANVPTVQSNPSLPTVQPAPASTAHPGGRLVTTP
jgi:outer membrane protein OmpA-like peptidoglycan-associated protein